MESLTLHFVTGGKPLYHQLYTYLVGEIQCGRLSAGEKLPSKRRLAEALHISLNTVDTAYQMLVAEGYLAARPRSGFTVCRLERLAQPVRRTGCSADTAAHGGAVSFQPAAQGGQVQAAEAIAPRTQQGGLSRTTDERGVSLSCAAAEPLPCRYHFETTAIDTTLFPFKAWRRLQRDLLAGNPALLNHGHRQGDENLREAIATYLHEYRGAQCSAEQIIVGAGIEYLLGLLARMFANRVFAVENPGYARTHRILENSGARCAFVSVDDSGMTVDALSASGAQLAYVTPSHQFPTGVTMPAGRRTELLHWAESGAERYLIEDDYDSEFRFDGKPLPALQGLDDGAHVIYISTFSKSIAPAIRIGYMVLPPALLARYRAEFGFYSCTVCRFEQQTLCRFMEEGYFARHLARLRSAYRQRRDALTAALRAAFGDALIIRGSHTGLHLLISFEGCACEQQLIQAAIARGVRVTGLSAYYAGSTVQPACSCATLVLGYAGLAAGDIGAAVRTLQESCTDVCNLCNSCSFSANKV